MRKKIFLLAFIPMVFLSCTGKTMEIPEGYWVSIRRQPLLLITTEGDKYTATVYHILSDSSLCPVNYPIVRSSSGMYIQAEGRILISYSPEEDILFLSPGGEYCRPIKTVIK